MAKRKTKIELKYKQTKKAEKAIPRRKLTPRGELGSQSEQEIPSRKLTPRGELGRAGEEQIPQRELTPKGELGQEQPQITSEQGQEAKPAEQVQPQTPQKETTEQKGEEETGQQQAAQRPKEPVRKEGHSVSPSIDDSQLASNQGLQLPTSKEDVKERARQAVEEKAKKPIADYAKKYGKQLAQAIAKAIATAVNAIIDFFGGWVLALVIFVVIIILIAVLMIIGIANDGQMGKSQPAPAGTAAKNKDVSNLIKWSSTPNDVASSNRLVFLDNKDKDYAENSGLIDGRLTKALNYLISKHKMIRVSHIISEYQDMNIKEAGSDTNPQILP